MTRPLSVWFRCVALLAVLLGLSLSPAAAAKPAKPAPAKKEAAVTAPPQVTGEWTGDWGPYNPAKGVALAKEKCKDLECLVVEKGGQWEATFTGECGGPYKYTIKMTGRQVGDVVLFKGTTDLGKNDGVYDWVGRATAKEFAGFYTSSHHVGVFRLKRAAKQ